nr:F-box only protein 13 [Ipomoea trifida]
MKLSFLGWKSVADSATFRLQAVELSRRWRPVVYDSSEENWKVLGCPSFLRPEPENKDSCCNFVPIAASGGLLCFHSVENGTSRVEHAEVENANRVVNVVL